MLPLEDPASPKQTSLQLLYRPAATITYLKNQAFFYLPAIHQYLPF
jgi:hypothetical protein